jgi:hypothetical protein
MWIAKSRRLKSLESPSYLSSWDFWCKYTIAKILRLGIFNVRLMDTTEQAKKTFHATVLFKDTRVFHMLKCIFIVSMDKKPNSFINEHQKKTYILFISKMNLMKIQLNKILHRRSVFRQCEENNCSCKSVVNSFAVLRSRALSPFVQLLPVSLLFPESFCFRC